MKFKRSVLAVVVAATFVSIAYAADTAPVAPAVAPVPAVDAKIVKPDEQATIANLPSALAIIEKAGAVKVIKEFPAENNMTGYLIKQTNNGQYAIVLAQNNYVYVGAVLNAQGQNIVPEYLVKYAPSTDYTPIVDEIEKAGGVVTWGKAGAPVAYIFTDPNCIFCHKAIENAKALVDAGRLQLKVANVAFLKASSTGRAAAIMQAKDPVAAMLQNEDGFVEASEEGGIPPVEPTAKTKAELAAHAEAMKQAGFNGTPAFIYKVDGKWYGTMMGNDTLNNIIAGKK